MPVLFVEWLGENARQAIRLGAVVAAQRGKALKERAVVDAEPALLQGNDSMIHNSIQKYITARPNTSTIKRAKHSHPNIHMHG